jgi:hypothetical protein|tara:strand:- start:869 stop:1750 length:882 start_codon:yes stop_codon:yes gene_type:complete
MFRPFYNESIRKLIVAFGSLFNNIRISSTNSSGVEQFIKVPLSYGPKEKFIRRIEEDSSIGNNSKVQMTLPRLGFNITDMSYDGARKRNTLQKRFYVETGSTGGHPAYEFAEVPYNFNVSLYGFTRSMTDALQITEQILPYFTPEFNVTVNFDKDVHPKVDIPIILNNVTMEEEYEGDLDERRRITTQYDFNVKSYVFGERKRSNVILYTESTFFELVGDNYLNAGPTGAISRVDVGVSGPSSGTGGFSASNFITYTNTYSVGPSGSGFTSGTRYIDFEGNTYEGATFNPPNP